jgi:membrane protein
MEHLHRHFRVWRRALSLFMQNDALAAAGNMAFLTMLSLFPFIIFVVALSGFMGQTERGLESIDFFLSVLPSEVSVVLDGPIQGIVKNTGAEILTGSILFAIWTAAIGVEAARGVLLKAFGRELAGAIWARRLESLGVVIFAGVAVIAAMSILVLAPPLLKAFTSLFPDAVSGGIHEASSYLTLLISPSLLLLGLYSVYLALTPRKVENAARFPGTFLCVLILMATAKGLSVYLKYVDNYDVTYGSLAGVVIMQLFCFLVSLGFVLGAELNAAYTFSNAPSLPGPSTGDPETADSQSA